MSDEIENNEVKDEAPIGEMKTITAPALNSIEFGKNISDAFQNIDANFKTLSHADFVRGADGKDIDIVSVTLQHDEGDNVVINSDKELGDEVKTALINMFKSYPVDSEWFIGHTYEFYMPRGTGLQEIHNIYPIVYVKSTDEFSTADDSITPLYVVNNLNERGEVVSYSLAMTNEQAITVYDNGDGVLCWKINGSETGVPIQGPAGLKGDNAEQYEVVTMTKLDVMLEDIRKRLDDWVVEASNGDNGEIYKALTEAIKADWGNEDLNITKDNQEPPHLKDTSKLEFHGDHFYEGRNYNEAYIIRSCVVDKDLLGKKYFYSSYGDKITGDLQGNKLVNIGSNGESTEIKIDVITTDSEPPLPGKFTIDNTILDNKFYIENIPGRLTITQDSRKKWLTSNGVYDDPKDIIINTINNDYQTHIGNIELFSADYIYSFTVLFSLYVDSSVSSDYYEVSGSIPIKITFYGASLNEYTQYNLNYSQLYKDLLNVNWNKPVGDYTLKGLFIPKYDGDKVTGAHVLYSDDEILHIGDIENVSDIISTSEIKTSETYLGGTLDTSNAVINGPLRFGGGFDNTTCVINGTKDETYDIEGGSIVLSNASSKKPYAVLSAERGLELAMVNLSGPKVSISTSGINMTSSNGSATLDFYAGPGNITMTTSGRNPLNSGSINLNSNNVNLEGQNIILSSKNIDVKAAGTNSLISIKPTVFLNDVLKAYNYSALSHTEEDGMTIINFPDIYLAIMRYHGWNKQPYASLKGADYELDIKHKKTLGVSDGQVALYHIGGKLPELAYNTSDETSISIPCVNIDDEIALVKQYHSEKTYYIILMKGYMVRDGIRTMAVEDVLSNAWNNFSKYNATMFASVSNGVLQLWVSVGGTDQYYSNITLAAMPKLVSVTTEPQSQSAEVMTASTMSTGRFETWTGVITDASGLVQWNEITDPGLGSGSESGDSSGSESGDSSGSGSGGTVITLPSAGLTTIKINSGVNFNNTAITGPVGNLVIDSNTETPSTDNVRESIFGTCAIGANDGMGVIPAGVDEYPCWGSFRYSFTSIALS